MQVLQHRTMMMTRRANKRTQKTGEVCFIHISLLDNRLKIKSLRPLKWIIAESTIITYILITTDGFECKNERNTRQKRFSMDNHDE